MNTHPATLPAVEEDPFYVEDLEQMARAQNYRRWQLGMVAPYVKGKLLEIGGGIGNFTPELAGLADTVVSLEPNAYCYERLVEKTRGLGNVKVQKLTIEELAQDSGSAGQVDTILLMNVLEHIKEDAAMLEQLKPLLGSGGRLVVLVPAGQWAFGSLDQRLGHYRRYTRRSGRALAERLQLRIEKLRYYNFVGIWGWWWNARKTHRQAQSDAQIRFFDSCIVPVLSRLERFIPPPLGQSLLLVARKAF